MKRLFASIALVVLGFAIGVPPAFAHTDLVSSNPKDGAQLDAAPTQITLEFNEELLDGTVKLVAKSKAGDVTALSDLAQASGTKVSVPWPADAPGGEYELSYRIVSADGHPVTGSISFTYPAADATAAASATATPSQTPTATPIPAPEPVLETLTPSPVAEPSTSSSTSPMTVILIGLGIGVIIGLVIFAVVKKRS